jgi:hypothetical protein
MTPKRAVLVDDLIPVILEVHDNWWPRDFLRLALVSSQWLWHVRRRLYASPQLRSLQSCNMLAKSLAENPVLLNLVKSIDLRPRYNHHNLVPIEGEVEGVKFLLNIPELSSITLGGQLIVGVEGLLRCIANPLALKELHLDGRMPAWPHDHIPCLDISHSLKLDENITSRFLHLRDLRLSNLELIIDEPTSAPHLHLTELALSGITVAFGSLHHICHNSWDTLNRLSIVAHNADDLSEHVCTILERVTKTLQTFSYEIPDTRAADTIFRDGLAPLKSLQELHLSGVRVDQGTLNVIRQRCGGLEFLSIAGRNHVTCKEWEGFIQSGALPSLRQLNIPSKNGPLFSYWAEGTFEQLMKVCVARGIHLLLPGHHLLYN